MSWITIRNRYFNSQHIREFSLEDNNLHIEFSNGDRLCFYNIAKSEVENLNKFINGYTRDCQ